MACFCSGVIFAGAAAGACARTAPAPIMSANSALTAIRIVRSPCVRFVTSGGALEAFVAFAVIAAALLDPLQSAIAIGGLVGPVLVEAGFHAALARGVF